MEQFDFEFVYLTNKYRLNLTYCLDDYKI